MKASASNHLDSKMQTIAFEMKNNRSVNCRENWHEYLQISTMHGLKYVGDRTLSRLERAFFTCTFVLVVFCSIVFMSEVWLKWTRTPIITTLSSKSVNIKDMPFPAVTICNMNQVRKSEVDGKIPVDSMEFYVVRSLCRQDFTMNNETKNYSIAWDVYKELLLKVSPPCSSMFIFCEYGGVEFNCTSRFDTILTDAGLCCIFNGDHPKDMMKMHYNEFGQENDQRLNDSWSPESGYSAKYGKDKYPVPAVGAGNELGLSIILNTDVDDYFCSSTSSYGFKAMLHNPHELPKVSIYGDAIQNGYETRLSILPTISEASKDIRKISTNIRQCLFQDENFLTYYKTYSDMNCESECETKLLYENCGCILYYQPREHENITICGLADMNCMIRIDRKIHVEKDHAFECSHCLSSCFEISYDNNVFSTARLFDEFPYFVENNINTQDVSVLHVYYSKTSFRSQRTTELIGFTEFLANIGGLLGLFMGFSVISLIELFYFISIRPYCNYIRASEKRSFLVTKVVQKIGGLRYKTDTETISTVSKKAESASNSQYRGPYDYLD